MELIRPSFEIWEQGIKSPVEDMYKHIARCTRVCYQSEKKDDNETDEDFVKRVILRKEPWSSEANHLAMLEHGTVYLKMPGEDIVAKCDHNGHDYVHNPYSRVKIKMVYEKSDDVIGTIYLFITTNLRVLVENDWLEDLKYMCAPTEHHAKRVTVSFTTNIGVTREFNRHRVDSIAEESTRYCNYNKRNDGQLKIALPAWLLGEEHLPYIESHQFDKISSYCEDVLADDNLIDNWCDIDYYLFSLTVAEFCYNSLIFKGWKPQQAREVLPLATKTQLIHTAFVDDWKHFFALRADGVSGPPHPNAKLVAEPLKQEFIKRGLL